MEKDFDGWNKIKKETDTREDVGSVYFREREIWWVRLGVNIGFEQDGTNDNFERPVVVIKKYNPHVLLVVPLSTTNKRGAYYFPIGKIEDKNAVAILSQIRLIDSKRLVNRVETLDRGIFTKLLEKIVHANFGEYIEGSI